MPSLSETVLELGNLYGVLNVGVQTYTDHPRGTDRTVVTLDIDSHGAANIVRSMDFGEILMKVFQALPDDELAMLSMHDDQSVRSMAITEMGMRGIGGQDVE